MQPTFQAIFSWVCILRSSNRQLFNVRVYREYDATLDLISSMSAQADSERSESLLLMQH